MLTDQGIKTRMRGFVMITVVTIATLVLGGCGSTQAAQRVVHDYYQTIEAGDLEKVISMNPRAATLQLPWNENSASRTFLMAAMSRLEVEVGTARLEGDQAHVSVTMLVPDLRAVIDDFPDKRIRDQQPPAETVMELARYMRTARDLPTETLQGTVTLKKFGRTWLIYNTAGLDWP